jgi:hypothetical protein
MMAVTLNAVRDLIWFGEGATHTIVKVWDPSGYWNVVGIKKPEMDTRVCTSLCATPTNIVKDPFLIWLLRLRFQRHTVFFYSWRRQTGA